MARSGAETKEAILVAARARFAESGFDRTTIRSVASTVGVDPALVMHYFGNKDGLFAAAASMDLTFPDLTDVPADRLADVLVPMFLVHWRADGPMLALFRSVASGTSAGADSLNRVFREQAAPALAKAAVDRPVERTAMVGATLLGVAVARHVLGNPPLAAMSEDDLVRWLRPVIAGYLTGPLPD